MVDGDGMVHGVGKLADDADTAASIHGRGEDHGLEVLLTDSLATREGHQQSTCGQSLHGALVDGAVAAQAGLQRAVILDESRRIEDDEIKRELRWESVIVELT